MNDVPLIYHIIGAIGAFLILFGFYRTSIGKWKSKSLIYEMDNMVGAMLLIIYQLQMEAYIGVVINCVWMVVAIRGITSLKHRRTFRRVLKRHTGTRSL